MLATTIRNRIAVSIVAIGLVAGVGGVLTAELRSNNSAIHASSATALDAPDPVAVTQPISLPMGYLPPSGLAVSPTDGSVWAFATGEVNGQPAETLFHYDASGNLLRQFSLDAGNTALQAGLWTPIAVSAGGTPWLGIQHTLITVTSDNNTELITLPAVAIASSGAGLPDPLGNDPSLDANIDALTTSGSTIYVSRQFAAEIQTLNANTEQLGSSIQLPSGTVLAGQGYEDIAADAGGSTLSAAVQGPSQVDRLASYTNGSWSLVTGSCPTIGVAVSGSTSVMDGTGCLASANASGWSDSQAITNSVLAGHLPVHALPMAGGAFLAQLPTALYFIASSGTATHINLGSVTDGPSIGGGGMGSTAGATSPVAVDQMASASPSEVWFTNRSNATISLLTQLT